MSLSRSLVKAQLFLLRHRVASLTLLAALCGGFFLATLGLHLKEDVMDLLPTGDPAVAAYRSYLQRFGRMQTVVMVVEAPDEARMVAGGDRMAEYLAHCSLLKEVQYHFEAEDLASSLAALKKSRASLFGAADAAALDERLSPSGLRSYLEGWRRTLAESPAPYLAQQFSQDPLGLDLSLLKKMESLRFDSQAVEVRDGRVFSLDGKHLLLLARPAFGPTDQAGAEALDSFMGQASQKVRQATGARVAWSAGARFSLSNAALIKHDLELCVTLSSLLVALACLLVFRRVSLFLLTLAPPAFGGLAGLGLMVLFDPGVSAIVAGCGGILIGILVDSGIYLLFAYDRLPAGRHGIPGLARVFKAMDGPILVAAATTLAAFAALLFSRFPGYRSLGVFCLLGICMACSFTLLFLPLFVPLSAPAWLDRIKPSLRFAPWYGRLFQWMRRHARLLMLIAFGLTLALAPGLAMIRLEGDVQRLNALTPDAQADWDTVQKAFGNALNLTSIGISAPDLDSALREEAELHARLVPLLKGGQVRAVQGLSGLLPSQAEQAANRARWQAFWSPERRRVIQALARGQAHSLGFKPALMDKALASLPGESQPATPGGLSQGLLAVPFRNQLVQDSQGALLVTNVALKSPAALPALEAAVQGLPGAAVLSGRRFMERMVGLIYGEFALLGGIAFILNLLLLWLHTRDWKASLRIMAPLILCLVWVFGALGYLGVAINMMGSLVLIFVFGLVVDYAIFLAEAWRKPISGLGDHLANTGEVVSLSALTNLLGLGALVFAHHPVLVFLGLTSILGIGGGWLAVLLLLPWIAGKQGEA
jgi:predicted exporter